MELDILPSQERRMIERTEEKTSRLSSVNPVLSCKEKGFHSLQKETLSHKINSGEETTCDENVPKRRSVIRLVEGNKCEKREKPKKSRDTYVEGEVAVLDGSGRSSESGYRNTVFDHTCIDKEKTVETSELYQLRGSDEVEICINTVRNAVIPTRKLTHSTNDTNFINPNQTRRMESSSSLSTKTRRYYITVIVLLYIGKSK